MPMFSAVMWIGVGGGGGGGGGGISAQHTLLETSVWVGCVRMMYNLFCILKHLSGLVVLE